MPEENKKKTKSQTVKVVEQSESAKPSENSVVRKPKTLAQLEKERARRKRRRQKKAMLKMQQNEGSGAQISEKTQKTNDISSLSSLEPPKSNESVLSGEDALGESVVEGYAQSDEFNGSDLIAEPEMEPEIEAEPEVDGAELEIKPEIEQGVDVAEPEGESFEEPVVSQEPESESEAEPESVEDQEMITISDDVSEPYLKDLDVDDEHEEIDLNKIAEENPIFPTHDLDLNPNQNPSPESHVTDISLSSEAERKDEDLRKARELAMTLDELEETPVKQGLFGMLFDKLLAFNHKKKEQKVQMGQDMEEMIYKPLFRLIKIVVSILIFVSLMVGAFWLGSSLKIFDQIVQWNLNPLSWFQIEGNNTNSQNNPTDIIAVDLSKHPEIRSLVIFGENGGDSEDIVGKLFKTITYFGTLKDPVTFQETGMTAVIYYGLSLEKYYDQNKFAYYVDYLQQLNNMYDIDIYALLDAARDRDLKLQEFIKNATAILNQGKLLRAEIGLQTDEMKIANNSLNADKQRLETDYFVALQKFEGEKSVDLINGFIEISQKQIELKAKANGLAKLLEYYDAVLLKLNTRITAIEKNQRALVEGIKVVEIPGSNLDLVIRSGSN